MGLSETIIAAMIGAIATVSTALFQIFHALRNSKSDTRPKRGNSLRSFVAVLMLMLASAAGGFLYSELLKQHAAQDVQAMRDDLSSKMQALTLSTEHLAELRERATTGLTTVSAQSLLGPSLRTVESTLYSPACTSIKQVTSLNDSQSAGENSVQSLSCSEVTSQRTALCATIPSGAQSQNIELFASAADAHDITSETKVELEQDINGAKFSGAPVEYLNAGGAKTVCVNFLNWSSQARVARIVMQYKSTLDELNRAEPASMPSIAAAPIATPSVSAAEASTTQVSAAQVSPTQSIR